MGKASRPGRRAWLAGCLLLVGWTVAAYHSGLAGAFVFDDTRAIAENPSIRHLWPLGPVLAPPARMTVSGRPLVNLSLALNYALGGLSVTGYHVGNLLVHVLAGLVLAGLVRRTTRHLDAAGGERGRRRGLLTLSPDQAAIAAALLWLVHPLQTEAVTYVIQRAEALAALFYLVTLYATLRLAQTPAKRWAVLGIGACACGMATKETMVSAPLVALLFDRTFFGGSFAHCLRLRGRFYVGLAATWGLLAYFVITGHGRGGSVAMGWEAGWLPYALTQGWAVLHYLRLVVWPSPLVIDYGTGVMSTGAAMPYAVVVMLLMAAAVVSLRRWPVAGFLGCAFFAILAPSSGLVPIVTETAAEHRIYLPLAAVTVGFVLFLDHMAELGRRVLFRTSNYAGVARVTVVACLVLAGGLAVATARRNDDYLDPVRLWTGAVEAGPGNARARANLAEALSGAGHFAAAVARSREALKIEPENPRLWFNLGEGEASMGDRTAAAAAYTQALRLDPRYVEAHLNLAVILEQSGQAQGAIAQFRTAAALAPQNGAILDDLGIALVRAGNPDEGAECFVNALRLNPADAAAHLWLGNTLAQRRRTAEAEREFAAAIRLSPGDALAHNNWGSALFQLGRLPEAAEQFEAALRLRPDYPSARGALGRVRAGMGQGDPAPR